MSEEREHSVYLAKLAEQAERYDGGFWIIWIRLILAEFILSRHGGLHEERNYIEQRVDRRRT